MKAQKNDGTYINHTNGTWHVAFLLPALSSAVKTLLSSGFSQFIISPKKFTAEYIYPHPHPLSHIPETTSGPEVPTLSELHLIYALNHSIIHRSTYPLIQALTWLSISVDIYAITSTSSNHGFHWSPSNYQPTCNHLSIHPLTYVLPNQSPIYIPIHLCIHGSPHLLSQPTIPPFIHPNT